MPNTEQRQYRPVEPSDLPKIQAGQLKVFYASNAREGGHYPVEYISSRNDLWLLKDKDHDAVIRGYTHLVIDITPTKRYAIWNHKSQRFVSSSNHPTGTGFASKAEAEVYLESRWPGFYRKGYYIVEWEIKNDE